MQGTIRRKVARGLKRLLSRDHVRFEGAVLPPPEMRYCGAAFRDDATFLASGTAETCRLLSEFGLSHRTRLLEIGCGPGRLPIGILAGFGAIDRYDGVDIDARAIRWCRTYITARHPDFAFHHIAARHGRYNPDGPAMDMSFRLPFPDADYDLIYLHSVFANMEPDDVRVYAREFHRLLKPGGMVFLTAFVEEDVPPTTINPQDYLIEPSGPLHLLRYEKEYFLELLTSAAGLEVAHFGPRADLGGQSVVHLRRPA